MTRNRTVLLVIGSIIALVGFTAFIGGVGIGWAMATQRDGDGYFNTIDQELATPTAVLTTEQIDLGRPGPFEWWSDRHLVSVRIHAVSTDGDELFLGVAAPGDVAEYLNGVPHDAITSVEFDPFEVGYRRQNASGSATPGDPAAEPFWVASATGLGEQTLTWHARPGTWQLVVMHADGSPGLSLDVRAGVRIEYLAQLALALAGIGAVLLAVGAALILPSVREHHPRGEARLAREPWLGTLLHLSHAPPGRSPVRLVGHLDSELSRWKWLVKWFLAIPHLIMLVFLWIAFAVLTVMAWLAILFTGRYPRGIFHFNVGVLRWSWRVSYYCTSVLGTDRYPPFTLDAVPYPAQLDIAPPEQLSRGLIFVKSWLLAIPHLLIVGMLTSATVISTGVDGGLFLFGGGLISVLVVIAALALLFTGRYPNDLHRLIVGLHRWVYRVIAYVALMTDVYPPFRLDQGADEPDVDPPAPTPLDSAADLR